MRPSKVTLQTQQHRTLLSWLELTSVIDFIIAVRLKEVLAGQRVLYYTMMTVAHSFDRNDSTLIEHVI